MAIVNTKPREHDFSRPVTGSMLFPDLVWAHWAWQSQMRPHTFPPRGRAARLTARPPGDGDGAEDSIGAPRGADLRTLKDEYDREARSFQAAEGNIIRAYWCTSEASAVVLTEKPRRLRWLPWRRCGHQRLHRATDWVTADAPEIAELLHGSDTLAIRISRVLHPVPQRIAMEWVFSEQSYLLGFVERMGGRPSPKQIASVTRRHRVEVDRIEGYYDRAAEKAARIRYFCGMILGLGLVAGLGVLASVIINVFGELDLASAATRNFYACFGAGALGAIVSVMTRMRQENGVTLDYEVGPALIVMLGSFRPVLGAVFGTAAYFALESGFLQLTPPSPDTVFFYYPLFAFVAGFSERFAHVILGSADLTVARALSSAETAERMASEERPPTAGPNGAAEAPPSRVPASP